MPEAGFRTSPSSPEGNVGRRQGSAAAPRSGGCPSPSAGELPCATAARKDDLKESSR